MPSSASQHAVPPMASMVGTLALLVPLLGRRHRTSIVAPTCVASDQSTCAMSLMGRAYVPIGLKLRRQLRREHLHPAVTPTRSLRVSKVGNALDDSG